MRTLLVVALLAIVVAGCQSPTEPAGGRSCEGPAAAETAATQSSCGPGG